MKIIQRQIDTNNRPSNSTFTESNEERLANSPKCLDCKHDKVVLHLRPYKNRILKVCVNEKCFHYADLTKIKTWVK